MSSGWKFGDPNNPARKLNEATVRYIRQLYADRKHNGTTQAKLAVMYDVHVNTIRAITQRRTWRHVE